MANALTPVEFHGDTLTTTTIDGVPFVALKPICDALSIDWRGQLQRIKRHPVLKSVGCVTHTTGSDGKQYEMVMLPLDKLNGWLFGVSVSRVKPELRERLTQYQAECFDVLAGHFGAVKHPVSEAPSPESAVPALSAPIQSTLTEQQCQSAIAAAGLASFQVQMALARAVIAGGDDWKHQRWLIYFAPASVVGAPPVVECVGPDLRTVAQLCKAIKRGEISNTALMELTAASTTALAAGMRSGKALGGGA